MLPFPVRSGLAAVALGSSLLAATPSSPALSGQDETAEPGATPVAAETTFVVQAGRLHARPGHVLENAQILIRGSEILAVGTDLSIPSGTEVVEAAVVTAGFLDAWSGLGLDGAALSDRGATTSTRAVDALNAYGDRHLFEEVARAGVTTVRVQAGLVAQVGGLGALFHTNLDPEAAAMGEEAPGIIFGDAGVGAAINAGDAFDRINAASRIVSTIAAGGSYSESQAKYEHELAEWKKAIAEKREELEKDFKKAKKKRDKEVEEAEEEGEEFKEEKYKEDSKPKPPRLDRDAAVAARVADGEIPLFIEARRAAEIRELLRGFSEQPRVRWVLVGGDEAGLFTEQLAAAGVPVILRPDGAGGDARFADGRWGDRGLDLAARLDEAGVEVLLGGGGRTAIGSRDLPLLAAMAVGHGLAPEAALYALTVGPARLMDVSDRLGAVEVGKQADLVLFSGEPFDATSRVEGVYIAGELVTGN